MLEEPKPPDPEPTIKILASECIQQNTDNNTSKSTDGQQTTKILKPTPLLDIRDQQWYKKPNGQWACKKTHTSSLFSEYNWIQTTTGQWQPPAAILLNDILHDDSKNPNSTGIFTTRIEYQGSRFVQTDTGANICATGDLHTLRDVINITPRQVNSVNKDETQNATLTKMGYKDLMCSDGKHLAVKVFYGPNIDGTIISPQALVKQYNTIFSGWYQAANCDTNTGHLELIMRDGGSIQFDMICLENLWFHKQSEDNTVQEKLKGSVVINRLTDAQAYQLWHERLCHPGKVCMSCIHHHVKGVPQLRGNAFWRCPSCMASKLSIKQPHRKSSLRKPATAKDMKLSWADDIKYDDDDIYMPHALPGQHYHMDFGFVRGKGFMEKTKEGRTITSMDGYNSYLLIIDRATRYTWTFLTGTKEPPIKEARAVLSKFKSNNEHRTVRTDQGKELGLSLAFKEMVAEEEYALEITGSDDSKTNGMAERPHQTLAQMVRCVLRSANLGPEYWSYALMHCTKVYNRRPHSSIKMTPYQAMTGLQPDLTKLRIFGSQASAKKPGLRSYKLDDNSFQGIFLGTTAKDTNCYIHDTTTKRVKIGTHTIFDEAHMSIPASKAPLAAQALQRLGYHQKESLITDMNNKESADNTVQVQLLQQLAKIPRRGTKGSVGYDAIYPGSNYTLKAGETRVFPLDIAIRCPINCYTRVAPRSGLTVKKNITCMAGVIDPDYTGNVGVVLHNFGDQPQQVKQGDKIAQLIFEMVKTPKIKQVDILDATDRGENGFGSTDIPECDQAPIAAAIAKMDAQMNLSLEAPYHIEFSSDPYDFKTHRDVEIKGSHPTLGLKINQCPKRNLPQLQLCCASTPAAKLHNWRSELKHSYILQVNDIPVTTINDIENIIQKCRLNNEKHVRIQFATRDPIAMHPQKGVPQLYHDQLNVIAKHLWELSILPKNRGADKGFTPIELEEVEMEDEESKLLPRHIIRKLRKAVIKVIKNIKRPKKLTRRWLQNQSDWKDWEASEHKQLDQYDKQKTFGPPQPYPQGENLLNLLWTYLIKDTGTKKARCVCNGSPQMGTVTLGETFAAALDQTGSRVFWAVVALYNFIVFGADVSNAFAEAPPPIAPLYVTIDKPFREWWTKIGRGTIPDDYVLRVLGALQGHPESGRLWAILIDKLIRKLNLKPCHHEPCLYYTKDYNKTGKIVLFLRQVDDFAVACQDEQTSKGVIADIDSQMTVDIKHLGILDRFNGVDILQTREYVKLHNNTYIQKIINNHDWLKNDNIALGEYPIPMDPEPEYRKRLETDEPANDKERIKLEKEYGFKYRQGVGEILFAMVTCRPDICFPIVKLSQYSIAPARIHFDALKHLYRYLKCTSTDGIYYWRIKHRTDLPSGPFPQTRKDNNYIPSDSTRTQTEPFVLTSAVDSDHATDQTHRKSVSGIIHKLAGGTVLYKSKYQDVIATSTSEAEFIAAAEAGKQILYLRTILDEIGIPQDKANILYEDNQGALLMANAQRPTKRTKHMDIKHFALQDWVDRDLITLKRINTSDNYSDAMTKPTGRTIYYRHMDFIQGKVIPEYAYECNKHKLEENRVIPIPIPITPTINKLKFSSFHIKRDVSNSRVKNRGG